MTKETKLQDVVLWVGDSVHDVIARNFDENVKDTSFKTMRDYAPYGDTEVEVCQYVSEEDELKFRENWERDTSVDDVINLLKEDKYFRECVQDMIEHIAYNRTLEV